jgi:localization factor PodJL
LGPNKRNERLARKQRRRRTISGGAVRRDRRAYRELGKATQRTRAPRIRPSKHSSQRQKKIDTALDGDGHASAFEEIGADSISLVPRRGQRADGSLARIEAMLAEQNAERQFADRAAMTT